MKHSLTFLLTVY